MEKITIIYDKEKKHLSIINLTKKNEENLYNTPVRYFSKLIQAFSDLNELTIDGFDFSYKSIKNKNISILNINTLTYYSKKNYNYVGENNEDNNKGIIYTNDYYYTTKSKNELNENIKIFEKLITLNISGDYKYLNELSKEYPKTLKKIHLYVVDKNFSKINNVRKRLQKNNIILIENSIENENNIIKEKDKKINDKKRNNKESKKYEEEEDDYYYEYEEGEYYEEKNPEDYSDNEEYLEEEDNYDKFYGMKSSKKNKKKENSIKNQNKEEYLFKSEIITEPNQFLTLIKGLKFNKINYKNSLFKILFRASDDGDDTGEIPSYLGVNKLLLLIIETTKGKKFGGCGRFNGNFYYKMNFLFDITHNKIHNEDYHSITTYYGGKIRFGNFFSLANHFFSKKSILLPNYKAKRAFEINDGEQHFQCKNLEFYEVL